MDKSRLIIAIALSFMVFFLWEFFFADKRPPQQPRPPAESTQAIPQAPVSQKLARETPAAPASPETTSSPARPARIITVDTPLYQVKISEKGATIQSILLKKYHESVGKDSPFKELVGAEVPGGTLVVGTAQNSVPGMETAPFVGEVATDQIAIASAPQTVSFRWSSPQGVVVEKQFVFDPDSYLIGFGVDIKNGSSAALEDSLTLSLIRHHADTTNRFGFAGPSALINGKLEQIATKKLEEKNVYSGNIQWTALESRYFISSVIPQTTADAQMRVTLPPDKLLETTYIQAVNRIAPQGQQRFAFDLFFGPKSSRVLNNSGHDLGKAIKFGMFDFIAKPCLWLMNFIHDHIIANYGIAIILLTVLIKLLLWPLGTKSYKSMNEMKKLQPLMAEMREKYKNDKKRMNQEVMGLYKTYKINPMGGCLPMVAQIPVFFALYRMLYEAIELRHAPFFGWINDLSAPDRLFNFSFSIPFMEPPYGIPVLTIVMGGTMLLQQKMTPTPGDPAQAKMMMLMPVVFTFIFINFSSGLVLYWLVNNVLSISQQYYISKKIS